MRLFYRILVGLLISVTIIACKDSPENEWSLESDKSHFLSSSLNSRSRAAKELFLENYHYGTQRKKDYEFFKEKVTSLRNGFIYYELNRHSGFSTFTYFDVKGDSCTGESLDFTGVKSTLEDCSFLTNIGMFYPLRDLRLRNDIVRKNIYNIVVVKIENFRVVDREVQLVADIKLNRAVEDRLLRLFLGKTKKT